MNASDAYNANNSDFVKNANQTLKILITLMMVLILDMLRMLIMLAMQKG